MSAAVSRVDAVKPGTRAASGPFGSTTARRAGDEASTVASLAFTIHWCIVDRRCSHRSCPLSMVKQQRIVKTARPYRLRARAAAMDRTRQRITRAAVELHGTIGPAATTMSAVAERAGVTRATLYRHFANEDAPLHGLQRRLARSEPAPRSRALGGHRGSRRSACGPRSTSSMPGTARPRPCAPTSSATSTPSRPGSPLGSPAFPPAMRDVLEVGWATDGGSGELLRRAALGHAVAFDTWRSLVHEGLDDDQVAELMVAFVTNATVLGASSLVEGAVQLGGVVAQPAAPDLVVGSARGDHRPEPRAVAEHPQVRELVDDDRLERLGRGEDEPPREGEPALPRGAPPARALVADADRGRGDAERRGVTPDLALDRGPGARLEPRLEDGRGRAPVRGATWTMSSSSSVPPIRSTVDRRRPTRAGTSRSRCRSPRKRIVAPSRSPPRATSSARSRACRSRCRRSHGSRSARNAPTCRSGSAQPRRPAGGTVTTTPRSGWMTTRRPRDRRRATEGVGERTAGQADDGRGLGRPRRQRRRSSADRHERRSRRPGRSPVSAPGKDRRRGR